MFFNYIWKSSGFTLQAAYEKFHNVLLKQCELYEKAFGKSPVLKIKQIGNTLIGQVQYDPGVTGWEAWIDKGNKGIVWGGVCENWLGKKLDLKELNAIIKTLNDNPGDIVNWDGMCSIITWDEDKTENIPHNRSNRMPYILVHGGAGWLGCRIKGSASPGNGRPQDVTGYGGNEIVSFVWILHWRPFAI